MTRTARDAVRRGFDALAPLLEKLLADPAVSAEHAMHVVVMNPAVDPRTPFDEAILAEHSERLRDGDIRVEGAVRHGHWIVGASGAQPWYDHAVATIAIALFEAAIEHARGDA